MKTSFCRRSAIGGWKSSLKTHAAGPRGPAGCGAHPRPAHASVRGVPAASAASTWKARVSLSCHFLGQARGDLILECRARAHVAVLAFPVPDPWSPGGGAGAWGQEGGRLCPVSSMPHPSTPVLCEAGVATPTP